MIRSSWRTFRQGVVTILKAILVLGKKQTGAGMSKNEVELCLETFAYPDEM